MPNTIPSSAAPNSTIRPASIVIRKSLRMGVLPLLHVHQPLAGNNLRGFVREARRPGRLESQAATQTNFIRSSRPKCGAIFNVTHSKHGVSCFVRNLATKFVLEAHGELDSVEAVGAEVVDEIIVFCYLIRIDAEMFGDDLLNPLANIALFSNVLFLASKWARYFARFAKSIKPC
jgi:hypothetical protein